METIFVLLGWSGFMLRVLLFGTGKIFREIIGGLAHNDRILGYEIIALIDNNPEKYEKEIYGYTIYPPSSMSSFQYDNIVLCCDDHIADIFSQLVYGYHIKKEQIKNRWFLLNFMLMNKYKKNNDHEIQRFISHMGMELSDKSLVFSDFISLDKPVYQDVFWDKKNNMPFIFFDTIDGEKRKMYYPRDYIFTIIDGRQYVADLMYEQVKDSPHRYIDKGHCVREGDVIADVGVCEGNFALRYINIARKIYLFECDIKWQEALLYTFRDDMDKIYLSNKAVSNRTGASSVQLDDVINGRLDFLKMDIEGFELAALEGADSTLSNNDVRCSICSYHRFDDERRIKNILQKYGYTVSTSGGYMLFVYDPDIFFHVDLRKGIVYGNR